MPPAPAPQRPWILVNMAMTADGKIATSTHSVHTFGSPRDTARFYALRATADALLCGARTVEETGATLGNGGDRYTRRRRKQGLSEFPLRVIVSGTASLTSEAKLWSQRFSPIVVLVTSRARSRDVRHLEALGARVWRSPGPELDFTAAVNWLGAEYGIRRLLAEGGGGVNDGLFRAGLVDELHLTLCPWIFGGRTAPGIAEGVGFARLADAARFDLVQARRSGNEFFLHYRAVREAEPAAKPS